MNRYSGSRLVFAAGVLLVAALALSGCGTQSGAAESPRESISVSGFGEATGTPDMATIQLGVETQADNVARAVETSNEMVARVTQGLLDFGIAETDLQSTNFNVWYQDEFDPATGRSTGERTYHVDSTINVTVRDISRISATIQAGLDAGANNVFGLTFGIDDSTELEAEARGLALEDARDRAEQLASALGMTLGDPIVVSELVGGSTVSFAELGLARGLGGGGGGPPLSPGELTVGIQVDVMYSVDG